MTDEDEMFLTHLHRALELKDFGPEDSRYVDLEQYPTAVGPDAVKFLRRAIMRTTEGSVFFLSGLRGAGKSTQLRRLQGDLNATGFAAVHLDAEDYLNLRQPIDVVEFISSWWEVSPTPSMRLAGCPRRDRHCALGNDCAIGWRTCQSGSP